MYQKSNKISLSVKSEVVRVSRNISDAVLLLLTGSSDYAIEKLSVGLLTLSY